MTDQPTATETITVADYMAGKAEGLDLYIDTFRGRELVTGYRISCDCPWLVCGKGWLNQHSYMVSPNRELMVDRDHTMKEELI